MSYIVPTRRDLIAGAGAFAAGRLLPKIAGDGDALAPHLVPQSERRPVRHHVPRAKRIVQLFMAGAPSNLDLFDDKPELRRYDGKPVPDALLQGQRFAFLKGVPNLLGSPYRFAHHGDSRAEISELLPYTAAIADDLAFVKSVYAEQFNHGPAQVFANTGHHLVGRPSLGSWLLHALGADTQDLPGFCVLVSGKVDPGAGSACWGSGFLPSTLGGVELRTRGDLVPCVQDPAGMDRQARKRGVELIARLNAERSQQLLDPEIAARSAAYRLAYRMQDSAPELARLEDEPDYVHRLYGSKPNRRSFANNCLLARRLLERGARCVQVIHRGWITMAQATAMTWCTACPTCADKRTRPQRHSSPISSSAACSRTRWWFGAVSLAARRCAKCARRATSAAITIRAHGRCGLPAVAFAMGKRSVPPTNSATPSAETPCTCTTCMQPSCTCWASTTNA